MRTAPWPHPPVCHCSDCAPRCPECQMYLDIDCVSGATCPECGYRDAYFVEDANARAAFEEER